ncbi:macrophage colony-stimulating factor 1-like isoform X3 [Polyodon spathula]|uniref:macrophage colony-stimulating factor 1-like isoform X3 n=1 Tax=Polyodon spathula TaxID=7913 RepID=UPI001B7E5028|nr:macrophage colony-stimulating factor 1-like isoform X3 [Polyodon spathula]
MNKLKAAHALCKAKARQLCFLVLLCFHLASGDVPGPCKYSVTNDHIQTVNTLIVNQLENGCSIEYKFIDQGSLSKTCYVKAAFPKVLDVLTKHFNYHKSSVNFKYVDELKTLVNNIYRTECIPEVSVSVEDDPEKFVKAYAGSPAAVLGHIRKVMSFYMELLTENNRPINWNCADQYAQDVVEPATEGTLPTGTTACQCSCPTVGGSASESASTTAINLWKNLPNPTVDIPNTPYSTELPQPQTGSPSTREGWGIPSANPGTTRSYRHRTIDTDTTSGASINNFQTSSEKNPTSPSFTSIPSPQDEDNTGSPTSEYTPTSSEAQGYGSKILGHGEGEIQPSDGPRGGRQSEKESQYEAQNPYKQLFISAAVCGGLLGICAIYCFIQKKKLQARLHKQEQDERLKQHSHCLEMEESTLLKRQSGSAL